MSPINHTNPSPSHKVCKSKQPPNTLPYQTKIKFGTHWHPHLDLNLITEDILKTKEIGTTYRLTKQNYSKCIKEIGNKCHYLSAFFRIKYVSRGEKIIGLELVTIYPADEESINSQCSDLKPKFGRNSTNKPSILELLEPGQVTWTIKRSTRKKDGSKNSSTSKTLLPFKEIDLLKNNAKATVATLTHN